MHKKLRIIQAIPDLGKGGAERLVIDICRQLHKRNDVEYRLVIFHDVNEYEFLTKDLNVVYCPVKVNTFRINSKKNDLKAWVDFIKEFRPDIIHSHIYFADLVCRSVIIPGVKYFSHLHGLTTQFEKLKVVEVIKNPKQSFLYWMERKQIKSRFRKTENIFFPVSVFYKEYLYRTLGFTDNVSVMHNAIDSNRFYRERGKLLKNNLKLITVGSLITVKNHIFLLDVMVILKKAGIIFELLILGEGPLKGKIIESVKEKELDSHVILKGNVDKPEDFYASSDIYIHSALNESFGLTLIEAMAAGLPVITLDGGGNKELIVEGGNGFLIHEHNVDIFAEKIIQLYTNPLIYNQMSKFAIEFAKKFDIQLYISRLLELYQN